MARTVANNGLTISWPVTGAEYYLGCGLLLIAAVLFFFESDDFSKSLPPVAAVLMSLTVFAGMTSFLPPEGLILHAESRTLTIWHRRFGFLQQVESFAIDQVEAVVARDPDANHAVPEAFREVSLLLEGDRIVHLPILPNPGAAYAMGRRLAEIWNVPVIDWHDPRWARLMTVVYESEWHWPRYLLAALFAAYLAIDALVSPPTPRLISNPYNLFDAIEHLLGPKGLAVALGIIAALFAWLAWRRWTERDVILVPDEPDLKALSDAAGRSLRPPPFRFRGRMGWRPDPLSAGLGVAGLLVLGGILFNQEREMAVRRAERAQDAQADADLAALIQKTKTANAEQTDAFEDYIRISIQQDAARGWTALESRWIADSQADKLGADPAEVRASRARVRAALEPLLNTRPKNGSVRLVVSFDAPASRSSTTATWRMLLMLKKVRTFTLHAEDQPLAPDAPVLICFGFKDGWRFAAYDLWFPERAPLAKSPADSAEKSGSQP